MPEFLCQSQIGLGRNMLAHTMTELTLGKAFILIAIVTFICHSETKWVPGSISYNDHYKAAVVEYEGGKDTEGLTAEQILWKNAENYRSIIFNASAAGADIIVFAEYGLTGLGVSPPQVQLIGATGENPCVSPNNRSSEVIRYISCSARSGQIYVVIDILELVMPGTEEGRDYVYNTALAFDRNGELVAKYHKTNLAAGEAARLDAPEIPEIISFHTDFGVEFGMLICFDILFEQPALPLLEKGVRHFVFPTAWIDELPYLTAIQSQTFWSSSASSILLASGYHKPTGGALGSGIFTPSGQPLSYIFDPNSGTQIVYAVVPKVVDASSLKTDNVFGDFHETSRVPQDAAEDRFYYREDLQDFTVSQGLGFATTEQQVEACENGFCCSLRYTYGDDFLDETPINHRIVAFNRFRGFPEPVVSTMRLQICSVVRCLNERLASCNLNAPDSKQSSPRFNSFELQASGLNKVEKFRPGFTTLDSNLDLIPFTLFDRKMSDNGTTYTVSSKMLHNVSIQTIAIYHRAA